MSETPELKEAFRPSLNSYQLLLWVVVLLLTNMVTRTFSWQIQMIGLLPLLFMMYHVYLGWRVYRLEEDAFTSSNWFGKEEIPYNQIETVSFRDNGMLRQYLFGYPVRSILIRYRGKYLEVLRPEENIKNSLEALL